MKILIVIHDYLPAHIGGSELHAHQLAKALIARGHELVVLFTERDLSRPEGDVTLGEFEGVPTVEVVHQREYPSLAETWEQSFFAEVFRAQLQRLDPDVVHFQHTAFWGARCLEIAKQAGKRVVLTLHDFFLMCNNSVLLDGERLCDGGGEQGRCAACLPADMAPGGEAELLEGALARRALHRRALQSVDQISSPSHFLLSKFEAVGLGLPAKQQHVIWSGYPGERRSVRPRDVDAPLRVVYLGGIYRAKGVHVLLNAFRELAGRERTGKAAIELRVHGHLDWFPDYAAELRATAGGLPVTFEGPFPSGEAGRILGDADVLVVPSIWYENRPITISEAFLNGVVPVTTDLGGMAESVTADKNGLTFARGDAAGLADCLERLADEPGLLQRLGEGRPELPTMDQVAEATEALYR